MNRYLHLHIQLSVTISIQKYLLEVALIFKKRQKSDDLQIADTIHLPMLLFKDQKESKKNHFFITIIIYFRK